MATKPKTAQKTESKKLARKEVPVGILKEDSEKEIARKYVELLMSPEFAAYRVVSSADGKTNTFEDADVPSLVKTLREQAAAVNRGEMGHVEAMLMNQAGALQTLFARLTERALVQEHMPNLEGFMRMALRAQSQCRATLETLAAIKNPPVVFAKQANINHGNGNQQVNNGAPAQGTRTKKNINQQNELLEVQHGGETVDGRATGEAIRKDKAVAAVD